MSITDAELAELETRGYIVIHKKEVVLTNAQIKALPSTAVEVVTAPGIGKSIAVFAAWVIVDNTAAPYDSVANRSVNLVYMTGGQVPYVSSEMLMDALNDVNLTPISGQFFIATSLQKQVGGVFDGEYITSLSQTGTIHRGENAAVGIKDDYAGVSNYGGGSAANTMKVIIVYCIVDVS